jgi:hypothetical protein
VTRSRNRSAEAGRGYTARAHHRRRCVHTGKFPCWRVIVGLPGLRRSWVLVVTSVAAGPASKCREHKAPRRCRQDDGQWRDAAAAPRPCAGT